MTGTDADQAAEPSDTFEIQIVPAGPGSVFTRVDDEKQRLHW